MYLIPWGLLVIAIVLIDMATKYLVSTSMALHQSIPLINGVFHITYVLNDGASFGIFRGGRWFFVAITLILIGFIAGYVIYKKEKNKLYLLSAAFIIGGGIGNLIDRVLTGKVVDFFDFCLINFAVFNVADCFIVVGVILMLIYCIVEEIKAKKTKNGGEGDGNI